MFKQRTTKIVMVLLAGFLLLISAVLSADDNCTAAHVNQQPLDADLLTGFARAKTLAEQGETAQAVAAYQALIEDYPQSYQLYVNLAALQVQLQQLEQARATLNAGIQSQTAAATLYKALQNVHGELAARAYRRALSDDNDSFEGVEGTELVPRIETLQTQQCLLNQQ